MFRSWLLALLLFFSLQSQQANAWWFWTPGDTVDNVGYKPEQPIPFSHKLHAGDRKLPCQYCHSSARRSPTAGIPSSNTCMTCHKLVRTDRPAIKYLTEKYQKNEPIEWVKVHDLPDFVRFTHERHVTAGLSCQKCHGPVETMDVVSQGAPLQMGWCVGCHKDYKHDQNLKPPLNCNGCHY